MSDRRDDAWDEEAISRALVEALAVDPSPGFRARVEARVALEPPPVRHRSWVWSVGVAAAAGVVAALVVFDRSEIPWREAARLGVVGATEVPSLGPDGAPAEAHHTERQVLHPVEKDRTRTDDGTDAPPVRAAVAPAMAQFDPRERDAFDWFLSLSADASIPLASAWAPGPEPSLLSPIEITAIEVPTVSIAEIGAATVDTAEGEPQP